jgi:putative SOS response-associated peptidase YedK
MKLGASMINAMAETVDTKLAFRGAFERRRCLVPVDNFYEWQKTGPKEKQPYAIALADRGIMALAGLWENWKSPAGEWVRSFTIITTTPNELCAPIHNRMPVILSPDTWPVWLGEEAAEATQLKALLAPYPADRMTCWPGSARVGNVKNNDPSLVEPVSLWYCLSLNSALRRGTDDPPRHAGSQFSADSCHSPNNERSAQVDDYASFLAKPADRQGDKKADVRAGLLPRYSPVHADGNRRV